MNFNIPSEWKAPLVGALSFAAGAATGWVAHQKYRDRSVARLLEGSFDNYLDGITEDEPNVNVVLPSPEKMMVDEDSGEVEVPKTFTKPALEHLTPKEPTLLEHKPNPINVFDRFAEAMEKDLEAQAALALTRQRNAPLWNQAEEEASRTKDAPYIISMDEFRANTEGYRQQMLTWYEVDKVLADENDVPVYNPEKVVGRLEFGRGSPDPDVVFVRNDEHRAEYEITRLTKQYAVEVMGLRLEEEADGDDLKHSRQIRRFKLD